MQPSVIATSFILMCLTTLSGHAQAPRVDVTIDNIISGSQIEGTVSNLAAAKLATSCIVVYVHTDMWYIHPYANGGAGSSFAWIAQNGKWSIPTVKRQFPADMIAALVVPDCKDVPARPNVPATTPDTATIKSMAVVTKALPPGSPDFGKL
jgi:hypothetical protein